MSTTKSHQTDVHLHAIAERHLERLWDDPGLCSFCFARRRTYHTEYEEDVASHLTGRNTAALEARGHTVDDDGTLLVNTATSTPDPGTVQEVVPPTEIDGRHYPPRPKTICECGTVDYDPTVDRTVGELFEALENIARQFAIDDVAFDDDAAIAMLKKTSSIDALAGKDADVLRASIKLGLKHG